MSEERLERIETKLDALVLQVKDGQAELRRHMQALHEDTLNRIADVAIGPDFFDRRIDSKVNELREEINQRLDPIEATLRRRRR